MFVGEAMKGYSSVSLDRANTKGSLLAALSRHYLSPKCDLHFWPGPNNVRRFILSGFCVLKDRHRGFRLSLFSYALPYAAWGEFVPQADCCRISSI